MRSLCGQQCGQNRIGKGHLGLTHSPTTRGRDQRGKGLSCFCEVQQAHEILGSSLEICGMHELGFGRDVHRCKCVTVSN